MEKIKTFLKKVGNTVYDLCIDSNRWMHMIVGGGLWILMALATVVGSLTSPNVMQVISVSTLATFIAMCSVEYKDKAHGGKFDGKDVLAGMMPAIILDVIVLLTTLFN